MYTTSRGRKLFSTSAVVFLVKETCEDMDAPWRRQRFPYASKANNGIVFHFRFCFVVFVELQLGEEDGEDTEAGQRQESEEENPKERRQLGERV